jgi:hypothetical protein
VIRHYRGISAPFFRAVAREVQTIAANSSASFESSATVSGRTIFVSTENSSQKADSSISSKTVLSFEMNSARDRQR